jgi:hypothetical protein
VTAGILIIHTPAQLDDASTLVDLLEASLSLPEGAIACSSLPGYAWASRASAEVERARTFAAALDTAHAAIALVDADAFKDPQLWFDIAAAWARGKRVAVVADSAARRAQMPQQLAGDAEVIERVDREALVALIEDLAFDLGVRPRIGIEAQRALELLSSAPPPPPVALGEQDMPTVRASIATLANASAFAAAEAVPPAPAAPAELNGRVADRGTDAAYELSDHDFEQVPAFEPFAEIDAAGEEVEAEAPLDPLPDLEPPADSVSCQLSLEAGRAISECSFHRGAGGDFSDELQLDLERSFGCFIDAVGGNWMELKRLGDTDLWLGATDNLLEGLEPRRRYIADWYEIGFQFAALHSIAGQGIPDEPEQRAMYEQLWEQSMQAFQSSAESASVDPRERRRQQALLENLIGPESRRDYTNVARSLQELRALAEAADRR